MSEKRDRLFTALFDALCETDAGLLQELHAAAEDWRATYYRSFAKLSSAPGMTRELFQVIDEAYGHGLNEPVDGMPAPAGELTPQD